MEPAGAVRHGQAKRGARREWSPWERCDMDKARQGERREGANQLGSSSQWPGIMAHGETREEAARQIQLAFDGALEVAAERGIKPPAPALAHAS
jgi:predicted RNase H-like HicB family nuclease